MNNVTILITAAGTQSMPGLADCFHNNGERAVRIVAADMNDDKTILHMADAFYQVPRVTDTSGVELFAYCQNFISDYRTVCRI